MIWMVDSIEMFKLALQLPKGGISVFWFYVQSKSPCLKILVKDINNTLP